MNKRVLSSALALACISISSIINAQQQAPQLVQNMPDLRDYAKRDDIIKIDTKIRTIQQEIRTLQTENKRIEDNRTNDNQTMLRYIDNEIKKNNDDLKATEERINRRAEAINIKVEALEKMMITLKEQTRQLEMLIKKETGFR